MTVSKPTVGLPTPKNPKAQASASPKCLAVAYSGGRDSTALLYATLLQAQQQGIIVYGLHVHHGLSPHADAWLEICETQCRQWALKGLPVVFGARRLGAAPAKGDSIEAWARIERYKALHAMATERRVSLVLLAHHRRDQAETLLLQALRGAGVAGLAGMPRCVQRDGVTWARPWLAQPREAIDAYVQQHGLQCIEDDSNAERRFARNRLRLDVWPGLLAAFAHAEKSLSAAACWAQEAQEAQMELARVDLSVVASSIGLSVDLWRDLSAVRRSHALRFWLQAQTGRAQNQKLVLRLLDELPRLGRGCRWSIQGGQLCFYRGWLTWTPQTDALSRRSTMAAESPEQVVEITREGIYALPGWAGTLVVAPATDTGVPLAWIRRLEIRPRKGGERFQRCNAQPARSLKKQFQTAAIPPWARTAPLFFKGELLVFVPGLGLDARALQAAGQNQEPHVTLTWEAQSNIENTG